MRAGCSFFLDDFFVDDALLDALQARKVVHQSLREKLIKIGAKV